MSRSRRALLRAIAVGGVGLSAGCSISVGTTDLTVRNCTESAHEVSVQVVALADDRTVYDETHDVPGETCVDIQEPPVAVGDLIDTAGSYRVTADAEGFESVTATREFDELAIENDDDTTSVRVEENGLTVG